MSGCRSNSRSTLSLHQLHFWPFWSGLEPNVKAYMLAHANTVILQRADGAQATDVFSLYHQTGLYMTSNAQGSANGFRATI